MLQSMGRQRVRHDLPAEERPRGKDEKTGTPWNSAWQAFHRALLALPSPSAMFAALFLDGKASSLLPPPDSSIFSRELRPLHYALTSPTQVSFWYNSCKTKQRKSSTVSPLHTNLHIADLYKVSTCVHSSSHEVSSVGGGTVGLRGSGPERRAVHEGCRSHAECNRVI